MFFPFLINLESGSDKIPCFLGLYKFVHSCKLQTVKVFLLMKGQVSVAFLYIPKIIDLNVLKDYIHQLLCDFLLCFPSFYSKHELSLKEISLSLKLRQKQYCKEYFKENEIQ